MCIVSWIFLSCFLLQLFSKERPFFQMYYLVNGLDCPWLNKDERTFPGSTRAWHSARSYSCSCARLLCSLPPWELRRGCIPGCSRDYCGLRSDSSTPIHPAESWIDFQRQSEKWTSFFQSVAWYLRDIKLPSYREWLSSQRLIRGSFSPTFRLWRH